MVPTSASCGRPADAGFGRGGAFGAVANATVGGGGRRDAEKIGRSRVFDNVASGIVQSGLALGARPVAAGDGSGDLLTTDAGTAGESNDGDTGTASVWRCISASRSRTSPDSAEVEPGTPSTVIDKRVSLTTSLRTVLTLVISRRHCPETAGSRRSSPLPEPVGVCGIFRPLFHQAIEAAPRS